MRVSIGIGLVALASGMALAGQGAPTKPKHLVESSAQLDTAPVSRAEAKAVFLKLQEVLWHGLHLGVPPGKVGFSESSAPVTRTDVVRELDHTFLLVQPKFKFTPPKVAFDKSALTLNDPKARPALEKLISWGAVARLGPIAAGSQPTVTVHQFGDAVGFFAARVADLAHLPSSRWTPYLNGGRG